MAASCRQRKQDPLLLAHPEQPEFRKPSPSRPDAGDQGLFAATSPL
jgi:hypothetical protein